uniref:Serpentine receptor class gamma n=1 Tax=Rhabditophanes sp. KR3021 TaxID=114890 RepID=A0AC35TST1_9BILA
MIVDIFSTIFYVLLLYFIIKSLLSKKPSNITKEFYAMFVINGIMDLILMAEEYFTFRLPQMGLFHHFYLNILASSPLLPFSSFNRLTAAYWPVHYKKIWSSWRLILILSWPFPTFIIFFLTFIKYPASYILDLSDGTMSLGYIAVDPNVNAWIFLLILHAITITVIAIVNIILIRKLREVFTIHSTQPNITKTEIALAKFAQVNFVILSCVVIAEVLIFSSSANGWSTIYEHSLTVYFGLETLTNFFCPYTLLIISSDIRDQFFIFLHLRKKKIRLTHSYSNTKKVVTLKSQLF